MPRGQKKATWVVFVSHDPFPVFSLKRDGGVVKKGDQDYPGPYMAPGPLQYSIATTENIQHVDFMVSYWKGHGYNCERQLVQR